MKLTYQIKRIAAKFRRKHAKAFDLELTNRQDLSESQQKTILIAESCIKDERSKLYFNYKTYEIQIQLHNIFITITKTNGYYECDIVFFGDVNKTSDKIIFERGGITHIYNKFHKEVERRMLKNITTRDTVVNSHLSIILNVLEKKK